MTQQLKEDMDELSDILVRSLDKTLKETRTKSGKNMLDLREDIDKFSEFVAGKLIESGLLDENYKETYVSESSSFFFLEYDGDKFSVTHDYEEHTLQHLKEAEEALMTKAENKGEKLTDRTLDEEQVNFDV